MTPNALLEEVKTRFLPLLVTDPNRLDNLLRQALRTYQDRAGVLRNIDRETAEFDRPDDALELVTASDANGNYVECKEFRRDDGSVYWRMLTDCRHVAPFRICYLLHLAELDLLAGDLPRGIVSLLGDYLECLIDIENTRRQRMANQTAGLPVDAFRTDAELLERKAALELEMQETAESLPIVVTI